MNLTCDEEDNKDDEELSPHEKFLHFLWGINQSVTLDSARILGGIFRHVPLLHGHDGIVESLDISQKGQSQEKKHEAHSWMSLQDAIFIGDANENYHDKESNNNRSTEELHSLAEKGLAERSDTSVNILSFSLHFLVT